MLVMVRYLTQDKRSGIFRYKRRVPPEVQPALGTEKIERSLRTKDPETARKRCDEVHNEVEAQFATLSSMEPDQREHKEALRILKHYRIIRRGAEGIPPVDPEDAETALAYRDAINKEAAKASPEDGQKPLSEMSGPLKTLARAMAHGVEKPEVRLRGAIAEYLKEKGDENNFEDLRKQTNLVAEALETIVGEKNPSLIDVTLDDAYAFRDHWINKGLTPETARRRLNTIKAVFNFAIKRYQLTGYLNPFAEIEVKGVNKGAKDARDALTVDEIRRWEPQIARLNQDAQDLWTLMVFTGARPKELRTLEKRDVILDHPVPHIIIRHNDLGRVKNDSSIRKVPLVGKALAGC